MRVHANTPNLPGPNAPRPTGVEPTAAAAPAAPRAPANNLREPAFAVSTFIGPTIVGMLMAGLIIALNHSGQADPKLVASAAWATPAAQRALRPQVKQLNAGQLLGVAATLSMAQEQYRRQHGHYATSLNALRAIDRTLPLTPGVTLTSLSGATARDDGWALQQGNRQLVHFNRQPVGAFLQQTISPTKG